jgi:hypothetical protein
MGLLGNKFNIYGGGGGELHWQVVSALFQRLRPLLDLPFVVQVLF